VACGGAVLGGATISVRDAFTGRKNRCAIIVTGFLYGITELEVGAASLKQLSIGIRTTILCFIIHVLSAFLDRVRVHFLLSRVF